MIENEQTGLFYIDPSEVEMIPIGDLKVYKKNAKKHTPEQVEQIINSIKAFGMNDPIAVWSKANIIVEGHGRYLALRQMGETGEVPCIRLDHLTDEQRRAYALAHNKLTMNTDFDMDILASEFEDLADFFEMADFGFDTFGDEDDAPAEVVEDEAPELDEVEPVCKRGQVWILGNHRLMCGDSTSADDVARLMNGEKADMVFTDPPYGISVVNNEGTVIGYGKNHLAERGKYAPIVGDNTTETASQAYGVLSQICNKLILWGGNYFLDFLPSSTGWLIWDKRGESGMRNNFADGEMAWCSFHTPVRIYHQLWNGMIRQGEHEKRAHPTQKPIKMLSEIIQDFSKYNNIVVDVFGGSGSTLIACEQLDRRCFMMELDPHYCDVIIKRWENLTGQTAVLAEE